MLAFVFTFIVAVMVFGLWLLRNAWVLARDSVRFKEAFSRLVFSTRTLATGGAPV